MRTGTIRPNDCGNCKHWHEWPLEKQRYSLHFGDCDKIKDGTPFGYVDDDGKEHTFHYDGYSFEDECYDDEFHCFEEDE